MGVETHAEEEPKGEILVGIGGEAVRPPGISAISFPNKFSTISFFLDVCVQQPPQLW